jgi:TonB family protein
MKNVMAGAFLGVVACAIFAFFYPPFNVPQLLADGALSGLSKKAAEMAEARLPLRPEIEMPIPDRLEDAPPARPRRDATDRTPASTQPPRRVGNGSESRFAQYVEDWRIKTERVAKVIYPPGERDGLYDKLVLTVSVRKNGTVDKIKIDRPSRYQVLNEAAEWIVRRTAPYAPFPPQIARDTDVLDITRIWTFANGTLNTTPLPSRPGMSIHWSRDNNNAGRKEGMNAQPTLQATTRESSQ